MLVIATLVHCSIMLLFGNCIIVCHMFLELYSLYCNDLYCPLLNLNAPQRLVWASFDFKNNINIHDLYPTLTSLILSLLCPFGVRIREVRPCYKTLPNECYNSRLNGMHCATRLELCTFYYTKTFVLKFF